MVPYWRARVVRLIRQFTVLGEHYVLAGLG